MCPERGEAAIAPAHARGDLLGPRSFSPLREDAREVLARIEGRTCRAQRAETGTIAAAVIEDTGGGGAGPSLASSPPCRTRTPSRIRTPSAEPPAALAPAH